jgi:hypothetical protein
VLDSFGYGAFAPGAFGNPAAQAAECNCLHKGGTWNSLADRAFEGDVIACAESLWAGVPLQSSPGYVQLPVSLGAGVAGAASVPVGAAPLAGSWIQYNMAYFECATKSCQGSDKPVSDSLPPFTFIPYQPLQIQ